jgi:adenylosuccinate synthase
MPTYIHGPNQERIQRIGGEFGATTGRKRDCCWLNILELREAARFCDVIYVTKLDVLSGLPKIQIAAGFCMGRPKPPAMMDLLDTWEEYMRCLPVYGPELDGWTEDISGVRQICDLPENAQRYLVEIRLITGKQIIGVGVGPEREQFCV